MKNVILLTLDTLRRDVLGCYGALWGLTPFIDSIQTKCIRFNKAQSTGPYTQAAFPGILTSSYYLEYVKEEKTRQYLSSKRVLVSEILQLRGITTAAFHSNAYLWDVFGWNRGWDFFYDSSEEEVTDEVPYTAASFLNQRVSAWFSTNQPKLAERPFFLWLHYMDVHEPYVPERKYVEDVDPTINLSQGEMMDLFRNVLLKRDVSDLRTVETLRKLYLAHVREIDDAVREFFTVLEKSGHLNDSVIIMTADHGDEFNEHGGLSHDGKMYSELLDVPLIIYDPALKEGKSSETVVSTIDVSPSILYLFDLDPAGAFEGHSLLPLEAYPARGVYGEAIDKHGTTEKGATRGVFFYREGDMKVIYREKDDAWELYDLAADPRELRNIIHESPAAGAMKERLVPRIKRWTS